MNSRQSFLLSFLLLFLLFFVSVYSPPVLVEEQVDGEQSPYKIPSFRDDFSDVKSGWVRASWGAASVNYVDNAYHILAYGVTENAWSTPGRYFDDVRIGVDATRIGGGDINSFGILCRYSGNGANFYALTISSEGFAYIIKREQSRESVLASTKDQENIYQGKAKNRIEALCREETLTLYVNGIRLLKANDSTLRDGDVGLIVGTFDGEFTEVVFDNFEAKDAAKWSVSSGSVDQ